jgi:hypothetical protein
MTQPATPPSIMELVSAKATAKTALTTANTASETARLAWVAANAAWGFAPGARVAGQRSTSIPTSIPTGAEADLTGLATTFFNLRAAQIAAQTTYDAADAALQAALKAAGA